MWRISLLFLVLLCVACGSRRPAESDRSEPTDSNSPTESPAINVPDSSNFPSPNFPSPNFPSPGFPSPGFPSPGFPEINFPVINFPEINFPEVTFPDVRIQQGQGLTVITLPADVLFDFDKDTIRPDAEAALRQIQQVIRDRYPGKPIEIRGYTDSKGDDAYNQALSERRATAVQQWLSTQGQVPAAQMTTKGLGEANPVAPNTKADGSDDPQGRQQNRRVEIVIRSQ